MLCATLIAMAGVIVDCVEHGIQEGFGISVEAGVRVVMKHSGASCPICGRLSPIINGMYEPGHDGTVRAHLFPTPKQLFRLKQALAWAQQELEKPDGDADRAVRVLEKTIETNAPAAKPLLSKIATQFRENPAGWLSVLIALITVFVSMNPNDGVSPDQLEQILEETVRSVQYEREPTKQPTPTLPEQSQEDQGQPPTVEELPTPTTH